MREIKFRAWHRDNSEMVYFNNRELTSDEQQRNHLAMLLAGDYGDVLMQFTGLRDSNGVDIYEGDIVEDDEQYHSVVSWCEDDYMYIASDVGSLIDMDFPIKVIGNMHENPDILEQIK